jgi:hypothetical protein
VATRQPGDTATGGSLTLLLDPATSFGMQVKGTGAAATAWNVVLEVSLDGTNFATLLTHASADADSDGGIVWSGANASPVLYARSRLVSVTLGSATNVVATIVAQ